MLTDEPPTDGVALSGIAELHQIARAGVAAPYRGEVLVWGASGYRARLCLSEQRIAWVHCNRCTETFGDVLMRSANVSRVSLTRAMRLARHEGMRLGGAMAALRILPHARLRAALHEHCQQNIWIALAVDEPLSARFSAHEHVYGRDLTFDVDEFDWHGPVETGEYAAAAAVTDPEAHGCREVLAAVPGAIVCGIVDLRTHKVVASAGRVDPAAQREALTRLVRDALTRLDAMARAESEPLEEVMLTVGDLRCALRVTSDHTRAYVLAAPLSTPPATVAVGLRDLASGYFRPRKIIT